MKRFLFSLLLVLLPAFAIAQSTFIPYNRDYYHLIDRFQIKFQDKDHLLQTTFKPVRRVELAQFLKQAQQSYDSLSVQDQFNLRFLLNDNWIWSNSPYNENDKSWWNLAYDKKSDFFYYQNDKVVLRINPVADFLVGNDGDQDGLVYTNSRGIEAQGIIDGKVGFYTFLTTTQARFAGYLDQRLLDFRAFPNEGFWKREDNVYDITHARGYFTFGLTNSIDVQVGYDKQFIGDGLRSMILSDFSSPILFGKINTRLGIFNYTNLFGELTEDIIFGSFLAPGDGNYPRKYLSYHRLGVNIGPSFELGVFESIISEEANINYFNPIIFYRAVEQQRGSPDNALLGLDFKFNLKRKYQFYGQFILDEFLIDALRAGNGDWRNKFGVQLGAKYIDALDIDNLDLQLEYNTARPFLFASENPSINYTNYRNPLAHPLGANFKEVILSARYQPVNKLYLTGKFIRSNYGTDPENGPSFGGDLFRNTDDRPGDLGNNTGQGVENVLTYLEVSGSYMLLHNVFLDGRIIYRNLEVVPESTKVSSVVPMVSLRWNLPTRQHEF